MSWLIARGRAFLMRRIGCSLLYELLRRTPLFSKRGVCSEYTLVKQFIKPLSSPSSSLLRYQLTCDLSSPNATYSLSFLACVVCMNADMLEDPVLEDPGSVLMSASSCSRVHARDLYYRMTLPKQAGQYEARQRLLFQNPIFKILLLDSMAKLNAVVLHPHER